MPKPLIGITTRNAKDADSHAIASIQHVYLNAITEAGGVPLPIPSILSEEDFTRIYSLLDGILFTGGGDISLDHFNGENHPRVDGVDAARDLTELSLLRGAAREGKPILGICRGAQLMNVALGGTLYTHIYDQLPNALDHAYPGNRRATIVHSVAISDGTRAAEVFDETLLRVNSLHHQGLKDIAPTLRIAGRAPDGLVEIVEIPDHPFALAVQWHPEWLTDQTPMRRLFNAFVDAARK